MFDFHNPLFTSFITVQVVGFPIVFLLRAIVRAWRAFKGDPDMRQRNIREAAANVCFAFTSIAFAFSIPVGVALLIGGVFLYYQAYRVANAV